MVQKADSLIPEQGTVSSARKYKISNGLFMARTIKSRSYLLSSPPPLELRHLHVVKDSIEATDLSVPLHEPGKDRNQETPSDRLALQLKLNRFRALLFFSPGLFPPLQPV